MLQLQDFKLHHQQPTNQPSSHQLNKIRNKKKKKSQCTHARIPHKTIVSIHFLLKVTIFFVVVLFSFGFRFSMVLSCLYNDFQILGNLNSILMCVKAVANNVWPPFLSSFHPHHWRLIVWRFISGAPNLNATAVLWRSFFFIYSQHNLLLSVNSNACEQNYGHQ